MPETRPSKKEGGRRGQPQGPAARRGIWVKQPEAELPNPSTIRARHAETVRRTYTSVVKVPIMKYTTATDDEISDKKDRIKDEKVSSSKKMEKRIKRFCHAYRLSNPDPNCHSKIAKDAPWLTSRADGTEQSHVINAKVPGAEDNHNDNNTIPLDLRQCHFFYKDTSIASWRLAGTKDHEIAKMETCKNNTSFREYGWRLSYLVCQGKRQMRLMARDKNEKCGPMNLFSQHSLVKNLQVDMPKESSAYNHEGIPISRAVRMMFQTADLATFEKQTAVKKIVIPEYPPAEDEDDVSLKDIDLNEELDEELTALDSEGAIGMKKGSLLVKHKKERAKSPKPKSEAKVSKEDKAESSEEEHHEEPQTEVLQKEEQSDNNSNNGQESDATVQHGEDNAANSKEDTEDYPPEPTKFPTPIPPESRTPSPTGKAKKVNSKSGCCAFL